VDIDGPDGASQDVQEGRLARGRCAELPGLAVPPRICDLNKSGIAAVCGIDCFIR
jgi:hypothetical protein